MDDFSQFKLLYLNEKDRYALVETPCIIENLPDKHAPDSQEKNRALSASDLSSSPNKFNPTKAQLLQFTLVTFT